MSTLAESFGTIKKRWQWMVAGGVMLLIWAAVALPNLNAPRLRGAGTIDIGHSASTALQQSRTFLKTENATTLPMAAAAAGRKIIRTTSMSIVVQHPAEAADKISTLAESLGGYLVAAENGGDNGNGASLTIRIPAAHFEQARNEIRRLGMRVENEHVDAQDVTRQYVDEDASLRNLRAEESQYLAIMKQAATVKDMLAVTEPLSAVRGQIERQQAELNTLSQQIETVAMTISLRTEAEEQVLGLNWRPGYQLKLALHRGLEAIANYVTAVVGILFYLPAVLLWMLTILVGLIVGSKAVRWIGQRSFGCKTPEAEPAK